ncbi:hypothetical protein FF1_022642 [Malus domestica]
MARERDHLYIIVPNLFHCPISMDIMRSPVRFCTGVTYEFESANTQICTSFKEDMIEKGDLGFFRLPLVRIPTSFLRPEVQGDGECSGSSSAVDNEFVNAGSSNFSSKWLSRTPTPHAIPPLPPIL